ncbi:hypothetical protein A4G19_15865 [Pasteurellaceae bacterium Macca]|nr:hypothetical protein [Pasteurellaceae bacterium Macca]MCK3656151.1 hypothetical protein [Pasteurellaceae bacterium Macca]MCK3656255.1 hypothetical protein [Pasteurellaceae bacterium Macca]MCK3656510.1 hypothetical protein [Pasteurellaceae bacterium Macca]MCK3657132.1 hypothetical protein [Pasteurellaceae bacterium Macca]
MRVRRLDAEHDWTFGQGLGNYASQSESVAQRVKTALWSFEGDWFLDLEHGLPWFEMMERIDWARIEREVKGCVLQTEGVQAITNYHATLTNTRILLIEVSYLDEYQQSHQVSYQGN